MVLPLPLPPTTLLNLNHQCPLISGFLSHFKMKLGTDTHILTPGHPGSEDKLDLSTFQGDVVPLETT